MCIRDRPNSEPSYINTNAKTKIVCTLGPSSDSLETLEQLVNAGMSVARLNMSHGDIDTHSQVVQRVKEVSEKLKRPVGIMVDVPGAKYRTGELTTESINIETNSQLILTSEEIKGDLSRLSVLPSGIHLDADKGRTILIDDGKIELEVIKVQDLDVICTIIRGGQITPRRGVVTPGKASSQKFPDPKAYECLKFAAENGADFVALSNVTRREEIWIARSILREHGMKQPFIISKIEKAEAIENLDEVIEVSDALMVARGDMGVEVPLHQVPVIQKDLIRRSNAAGKPVITATQMLESMIKSSSPTRAEVTDVANAVFDGTDAIMLSAETSVGNYPVESVKFMSLIAIEAENSLPYESMMSDRYTNLKPQTEDSISFAACQIAFQLDSELIVAFTESGNSAGRVSRYRPKSKILALTRWDNVKNKLTLSWGVFPVVTDNLTNLDDFFSLGERESIKILGNDATGNVVLVAGTPIGIPGSTNLLRVLQLN